MRYSVSLFAAATATAGVGLSATSAVIDQVFNEVPPTTGTPSSGYTNSGFVLGSDLAYTNGGTLVNGGGSLSDASGSDPGAFTLNPSGITITEGEDYWGSFLIKIDSAYTAARTSGFSNGPDRLVISFNTPASSGTTNGTIDFGVRDGAGDPSDGFVRPVRRPKSYSVRHSSTCSRSSRERAAAICMSGPIR